MRWLGAITSHLAIAFVVIVILIAMFIRAPNPTPPVPLQAGVKADLIIVDKSDRKLTIYRDQKVLKSYKVALGFTPSGHKERQGDGRTPEGVYTIDRRNDQSAYHLSLGVSYPDATDRAIAKGLGVDPGGDIFIHGQPNAMPDAMVMKGDWTAGCIAVSNAEMRELWAAIDTGTRIEIRP